jgi:hypothetical protein
MTEQAARERGTQAWVAARVAAMETAEDWCGTAASRELIEWLYVVAHRRVRAMGLSPDERADVVQDAMTPAVRALGAARHRLLAAHNPAAFLERVMARAVAEGRREVGMAGLGGVPANGRNWNAPYPRRVRGEAARLLLEGLPTPIAETGNAVEHAATLVSDWITENVGITLTADAFDAVLYVLDRLVAGVGRPSLLRGGSSCLRRDPAMRHLGFSEAAASAFAVWLLGRQDAHHHSPSVLDAVLGEEYDATAMERWRTVATSLRFADYRDRERHSA